MSFGIYKENNGEWAAKIDGMTQEKAEQLRRYLLGVPTKPKEEKTRRIYDLWRILDDIDSTDDWAGDNDEAYREEVRRIQKQRWDILSDQEIKEIYDRYHPWKDPLKTMQPDDSILDPPSHVPNNPKVHNWDEYGTPVTGIDPPDCSKTEDPRRNPTTGCNSKNHPSEGFQPYIQSIRSEIMRGLTDEQKLQEDLKRTIGDHSRSIQEIYEILDTDVTKIPPADTRDRPLVLTDLAEMERKQNRDAQRLTDQDRRLQHLNTRIDNAFNEVNSAENQIVKIQQEIKDPLAEVIRKGRKLNADK